MMSPTKENQTEIRVYYFDTDHGGVVYYANFLKWFEVGRTEILRQEGFDYAEFEKQGLIAPVVDVQCTYKYPASYNDKVIIKTAVKKVGNTSITFNYIISKKEDNTILAEGTTTNVFIDKKTMKPTPIPEKVRKAFE